MTVDGILTLAALLTGVGSISAALMALFRWIEKQNRQDKDIAQIKGENALIVYALSACLDGLMQLGANHSVPKAKEELDKYINEQAHK